MRMVSGPTLQQLLEFPLPCAFPILTHLKHHCYTQLPNFSKSYHGTKTFSGLLSTRQSRSLGLAFEGPEQPSLGTYFLWDLS